MSIPGLMALPIAQISALNPLDSALAVFNTNPYFIGIMMLMLNLGGRFLMLDVSKKQEMFFQNPWVRRILIFTVFFIATRSIAIAFWLTILAVLILGYLFNENSALCIFSSGKCANKDATGMSGKSGLTPDEQDILRRLSEKNMRYSQSVKPSANEEKDADATEIYMANMELLHR